jgi:CubicO group peptidase (beta-lactamase class C family)
MPVTQNQIKRYALRASLLVTAVVLFAGLASLSGVDLPSAKPEDVGLSSLRLNRIKEVMQRYIDRKEVPGVVILIARRGRVVYFEAQGRRDFVSDRPMTKDTIFRLASMTKPLTSVSAMLLYEEGAFLLSDPIGKWLQEFSEMQVAETPPPASPARTPYVSVPAIRPITVRHLLTHTSGLPNPYRGYNLSRFNLISNPAPGETMADVVRKLAALPLNFQPGDSWEYGPATDVLGRLIEVVSGKSLDAFFQERIFVQLGMEDTYFYVPESKASRLPALSTVRPNNQLRVLDPAGIESKWVREPHVYFSGAGGLASTASDYYRFLQMMLNRGEFNGVRLLGPKTVDLMTCNHTGSLPIWLNGPGFGFGLGFSVVIDVGATGEPASLGKYAWGGAYGTNFWVDPAEQMIGIIMTQVNPDTPTTGGKALLGLAYQAIIDSGVKTGAQ